MNCVRVTELDESHLFENRDVNHSEFVIDGLVQNHVIHDVVDGFADVSDFFNPMNFNVFEQFFYFALLLVFLDECLNERKHFLVAEINAEKENVEQTHAVLLDIVRELANVVDDFQIEILLLHGGGILTQSVGLFESVGNPMVKVDFFTELS